METQTDWQQRVAAAIQIIRVAPGYGEVAERCERLNRQGRLRFAPDLPDRAQTGVAGVVTLGPEVMAGSGLGLAETLVHEMYHVRQNPLEKTASFWAGVATRTPVMRRYERPAYQAALNFLRAYGIAHPAERHEADAEIEAVRQTFLSCYGEVL